MIIDSRIIVPDRNQIRQRSILTQPGLLWNQVLVLLQTLQEDQSFQLLPSDSRAHLLTKIEETIQGKIIEEIVIADLTYALTQKEQSLTKNIMVSTIHEDTSGAEYDVAISDDTGHCGLLCEIKHTQHISPEQIRWLSDVETEERIAFSIAKPRLKAVLYQGEEHVEGDIVWKNVSTFLSSLHQEMTVAEIADLLRSSAKA